MPLEQQVVSLELAKRLKELGLKQESLFCWSKDGKRLHASTDGYGSLHWQEPDECSAYLTSELGEMLPTHIQGVPIQLIRHGSAWGKSAEQEWWGVEYHDVVPLQDASTEADARAKCLIYLIENSLIPLPING